MAMASKVEELYEKAMSLDEDERRELVRLLNERLGNGTAERNLNQSRDGGYDISGSIAEVFAIEVKSADKPSWAAWFEQAREQARSDQLPVVAWRQRGGRWRLFIELDIDSLVAVGWIRAE